MTFDIRTIRDAAERIEGSVRRTPLLSVPALDDLAGARVLVKAESLQLTGSFKMRGALNAVRSLTDAERDAGVLAVSTGNHGQAVAAAAHMSGCRATIVMPGNAPKIKIEGVPWWGAEVVPYDPATEDREEVAGRLVRDRGATFVHPFDDERVMSGQGTVGLEVVEQLGALGATPDAVVVPCSGGGLSSGVFEALRHEHPGVTPFVVEREGYDKLARSLASGRIERMPTRGRILLDALGAPAVGERTLAALTRHDPHPLTVTDDEARRGMHAAFSTLKLVLEPGGAAALSAVLAHPGRFAGRTVVVVASGGNVDAPVFAEALRD